MSNKADTLALLAAYGNMRRQLSLEFSQNLKPMKMGSKQATILYHLTTYGDQSPGSISRATLSDPAATTRAIQSMIKKGWVKKAASQEDQRQSVIALTSSGQKIADQMRALIISTMDRLCEKLKESEKHTLTELLNKIGSKG